MFSFHDEKTNFAYNLRNTVANYGGMRGLNAEGHSEYAYLI